MRATRVTVLRILGILAILAGVAAGLSGGTPAPPPLAIDKPLVAYWGFDELLGGECEDAGSKGYHASPEHPGGLQRIPGLFGSAMSFSESHLLRVPEKPNLVGLSALSFSAWVLPTDLSGYREIFRKEDGDQRVLFAFQGDGTILSLGLNVKGYVECDAPIDPKAVLDGRWHHCAATFDGQCVRVYLDGKEIGALERPGAIAAGGPAPGCIGSSSGGENFQGAMDDLRIYAAALTPDEIARLYENGQKAMAALAQPVAGDEPALQEPLLAHWTFNEAAMAPAIEDAARAPALEVKAGPAAARMRGVHGNALRLADAHSLATAGWPEEAAFPSLSLSAWVRPTDLGGFREIFRKEDGENRILFSFQESGTVLSLGLNVNGYVECDAPLEPARVMDGVWHHCVASFDGQWMRVYLDGEEIGALERPGKIAATPGTPGFIGSSSGSGEHFQGGLDDLRIYRAALAPAEVGQLCAAGRESLARFVRGLEDRLNAFYAPGATFAETLAETRRRLVEKGIRLDLDLADVVAAKLREAYPEECGRFTEGAGAGPVEFLVARGDDFQAARAGRLVDLLLEYRPLTKEQKRKQTPDDLRKWADADAVAKRLDALKAQGSAARFSPDWIRLIIDAGAKVQLRPYVAEAVAPYVKPETPATRTLTRAEAREALERDWLHQAGGDPTPEWIRREVGWARQLAARIEEAHPGKVRFDRERAQLDALAKEAGRLTAPDVKLYFRVREVKRGILLRNPVVDFTCVLFVDMPYPAGSEWPHETRHRLGYMAVPGGRLLVLDGLSPEGRLTQLMPKAPLHGSFWRPDLSFDAKRVLFCFKPHNEKSFHLYEISTDGAGLRQLTGGQYDDFDPVYLPDEKHILFSTSRAHTYVRCMPPTNAYVLARCDRDGRNVYLVSANNEPDYLPSVMDDGRVIYTRWEYTDKPLWRAQSLWTMNPDGTNVNTFWGNQSVWPDLLKDARSIPGSRRVMFTGSAHHGWFSGSVGIIDPMRGRNFPYGVTKVTADVPWPEVGNGPTDPIEAADYHASGTYGAYYSPYPLSEADFLVSANRGGKFVLYLMDTHGNRELIYEGANHIFHAIPVRPRRRPTVITDTVKWPSRADRLKPADGVIFSANVYQGAPAKLQGKARFLRVLHIDPKTYTYWNKRPYISTGPVVSMVQSEGVKRVLGTVPIEADGSVAFYAPPGKALHFQLLDGEQRALQTMRSFASVMPGERRGCLGCHEMHSAAPQYSGKPLALAREPSRIAPPPWGNDTVSYARYVQPVLDRYCGSCHQGNGQARKVLDLTRRPGFAMFDEPYVTLIGRPTWGEPYKAPKDHPPGFGIANTLLVEAYSQTDPAAYRTPAPMTALSYRSRLVEIASSGEHHGVKVDPVSRLRLITWIDAMCPYIGDEEIREMPDPVFQGSDWLSIRPRLKTAPRMVRPGPVD